MVYVSRWGTDWNRPGFCSLYFHIKDVSYWWSLTDTILQHDLCGRAFIQYAYQSRRKRWNILTDIFSTKKRKEGSVYHSSAVFQSGFLLLNDWSLFLLLLFCSPVTFPSTWLLFISSIKCLHALLQKKFLEIVFFSCLVFISPEILLEQEVEAMTLGVTDQADCGHPQPLLAVCSFLICLSSQWGWHSLCTKPYQHRARPKPRSWALETLMLLKTFLKGITFFHRKKKHTVKSSHFFWFTFCQWVMRFP